MKEGDNVSVRERRERERVKGGEKSKDDGKGKITENKDKESIISETYDFNDKFAFPPNRS